MTVTLKANRNWEWVFVCVGCDLLSCSERSDKLTCSPACRVRAHRKGKIKQLNDLVRQVGFVDARTGKPLTAMALQEEAVRRLCPNLLGQIDSMQITLHQAMPEVYREFVKLVRALVKSEEATPC